MSGRTAKRDRTVEVLRDFERVPEEELAEAWKRLKNVPIAAFKSPQYLAALYQDSTGFLRLTINRIRLKDDKSGRWDDGITWDAIQEIKSKIGLGNTWGVEVFPPDAELIDVANMRHIFLLPEAPPFAWRKS